MITIRNESDNLIRCDFCPLVFRYEYIGLKVNYRSKLRCQSTIYKQKMIILPEDIAKGN